MGIGLMKDCWLEQEGNMSSAETYTWIDTVVMEHHASLHRVVATSAPSSEVDNPKPRR